MLKAVFFDMDGTLLPIDEQDFVKAYFGLLCKKVAPLGYKPQKLIDCIFKGTYLMYKNNGEKSNEEVFWDYYLSVYGAEKRKDESVFDDFYRNEFKETKAFIKEENPYARKIIDFCHRNVTKTILSTNPIFPRQGQITRLSFLGLEERDFDFITDYSNSSYCKPNPKYFAWLLEKYNLKPEEVILFGNNTLEDGDCASSIGIKTYLVKGHIIYNEKAKRTYEEVEMKDVIKTIQDEINKRK